MDAEEVSDDATDDSDDENDDAYDDVVHHKPLRQNAIKASLFQSAICGAPSCLRCRFTRGMYESGQKNMGVLFKNHVFRDNCWINCHYYLDKVLQWM